MIEIKGLKKSFGSHEVLKGIDLTIQDKEVVVIIGPSGSGKSTILRCINYLETPSAGEIIVDGISMSDAKSINAIRMEVGMVFQRFNLFPHMTVLQNIMLSPMKTRHVSKAEAEETALNLLKKVGLEDKKDAYPGTLSGGQQQRVAIARTLAMKPKYILFDEPTSALDPEWYEKFSMSLKNLPKKAWPWLSLRMKWGSLAKLPIEFSSSMVDIFVKKVNQTTFFPILKKNVQSPSFRRFYNGTTNCR